MWPRVEMLDPTFGISRPGPTSNKILREKLAIGTDRHCQRVDATELLARWACAPAITPRDKRRLRTNHFEVRAKTIIKGSLHSLVWSRSSLVMFQLYVPDEMAYCPSCLPCDRV